MSTIPGAQEVVTYWKSHHDLGEKNMRFGVSPDQAKHETATLEGLMDTLIRSDNGPVDANPEPGIILAKDDGEVDRFQGDAKVGSLESETADGRTVCVDFNPTAVDYLQITPEGDGFQALAQHFSREPQGHSFMQVGGKVEVIDADKLGDSLGDWLIKK